VLKGRLRTDGGGGKQQRGGKKNSCFHGIDGRGGSMEGFIAPLPSASGIGWSGSLHRRR
jgi:hypothetical protein